MSSAKSRLCAWIYETIALIYKRNNKGQSIEPCVMPAETSERTEVEFINPHTLFAFRQTRKKPPKSLIEISRFTPGNGG